MERLVVEVFKGSLARYVGILVHLLPERLCSDLSQLIFPLIKCLDPVDVARLEPLGLIVIWITSTCILSLDYLLLNRPGPGYKGDFDKVILLGHVAYSEVDP